MATLEAFRWAITTGDVERFHALLSEGELDQDVLNATDEALGNTLLHDACRSGLTQVIETLLQQPGIDCNIQNEEGETPMFLAYVGGGAEIIRKLLVAGADCNIQNEEKKTLLHQVCHTGDSTLAALLLDHGADLSIINEEGDTPLHVACSFEHFTLVQMFLARQDRALVGLVNRKNFNAFTPLQILVNNLEAYLDLPPETANPWLKVIENLLIKGADIGDTNRQRQLCASIPFRATEVDTFFAVLAKAGLDIACYEEVIRKVLTQAYIHRETPTAALPVNEDLQSHMAKQWAQQAFNGLERIQAHVLDDLNTVLHLHLATDEGLRCLRGLPQLLQIVRLRLPSPADKEGAFEMVREGLWLGKNKLPFLFSPEFDTHTLINKVMQALWPGQNYPLDCSSKSVMLQMYVIIKALWKEDEKYLSGVPCEANLKTLVNEIMQALWPDWKSPLDCSPKSDLTTQAYAIIKWLGKKQTPVLSDEITSRCAEFFWDQPQLRVLFQNKTLSEGGIGAHIREKAYFHWDELARFNETRLQVEAPEHRLTAPRP